MNSGLVWKKGNSGLIMNIELRGEISYELWSIDVDGNNLKQITNHPDRGNLHPLVSPVVPPG